MASMILGDAFLAKIKSTESKILLGQQLQALRYLLLELINCLCKGSGANAFAIATHLNFQLENQVDYFKSTFEGFVLQRVFPILKRCL